MLAALVAASDIATGTVATYNSITHSGQDDARQSRVSWTLDCANKGSVTAGEIIVAAPDNVSGNEASMWQSALGQLRQDVLERAYATAPAGWWPSGQPDFYADTNGPTHRRILAEVAAADTASSPVAAPPTVSSGGGTAPWTSFPYTPISPGPPIYPTPATPTGGTMLPTVQVRAPAPAPSSWMLYAVLGVVALIVVLFVVRRR